MTDEIAALFDTAHETARQSAAHAIRTTLKDIGDEMLAAMIDEIRATIYNPDNQYRASLRNKQIVNHVLSIAADRLRAVK